MKDYKELLAYQSLLSGNILTYVTQLQEKTLTKSKVHNRKAYAKRTGNLISVLEYTIALEIVNTLEV